ncbi:MAG: hypothetical protein ACK41D_08470 [Rubricoccaceae bacterium]
MSIHATYHAALRWARFARRQGARFDVERKAAESLHFSLTAGAHRFAVPSKLAGVREHAARVAGLRPLQPLRLHVVRVGEGQGTPRLLACSMDRDDPGAVGHVQPKHLRWLLPLVEQGAVRCHVLRVTGGTPARPFRGVNVVFSFTAAGHAPAASA